MKRFIKVFSIILVAVFSATPVFADDNTEEYKCDLMMRGYEFTNNGLSEAIIKKDNEALQLFLKANININLTDNEGFSALDRAINVEDKNAVLLISMAGGQTTKNLNDEHEKTENNSPEKPSIEEKKVETDNKNTTEETIKTNNLCEAVNANNLDLTAKLAKKSPYLNALTEEGLSPVHYAVFNDNPAMLHVLLNAGADVNILTDDGLTPLDIAVLNYQKKIAKELLENGGALSANVAKELLKFGCKAEYDEDFGLYDAEFNDIFETMDKIKAKIDQN